jgi:3-carboxy-cis,cis-muconate cycloisomerase
MTDHVAISDALSASRAMNAVFSDMAIVGAALKFERDLARSQAELGLIPAAAAVAIAAAARPEGMDMAALSREMQRAGTLAIPLVKALTARVAAKDPEHAGFVHLGATSQDVSDTALVLVLVEAGQLITALIDRLATALLRLAVAERDTPILARTLMQPGPPTTFGLKAAGWLAGVLDARARLKSDLATAATLQFGGAVGTLAALGENGPRVAAALARRLGLADPGAPWHTQRSRVVAAGTTFAMLGLAAGKMARDVSLLMQYEVGEAAEPGGAGRGGSSTMPHKRNPTASIIALTAAQRLPHLAASLLGAMVQEHERATGGLQAEWPIMRDIAEASAAALEAMVEVAEGITFDRARMRANIDSLRGLVFAERLFLTLAPALGRAPAYAAVEAALARALKNGVDLRDALDDDPAITGALTPAERDAMFDPMGYLGSAGVFVDRIAARARAEGISA